MRNRYIVFCVFYTIILSTPAYARMVLQEVPLERTAEWHKHVSNLRNQQQSGKAQTPPLHIKTFTVRAIQHSYNTAKYPPLAAPSFARNKTWHTEISPEWRKRIHRASIKHNLPEAVLAAVLKAESNFNPRAVSPKGAKGAMQLMPATGKSLGVTDFFDPDSNLDAGASYLSMLLQQFSRLDLALAAYNAGPGAVLRYGGIPPYAETQAYVASVLSLTQSYRTP